MNHHASLQSPLLFDKAIAKRKSFIEVPCAQATEMHVRSNNERCSTRKLIICLMTIFGFLGAFTMILRLTTNHYHSDENYSFLTPEEYGQELFTQQSMSDGQACFTALDCGPGSWCAFPSMHNMSVRVCCEQALQLGLEGDPDAMWLTVCTGAPLGEPCGSHHLLCASGICVHGKCASNGLASAQSCPDHGACASQACGRWAFDTARSVRTKCCPTHKGVREMDVPGVPYPLPFCHHSAGPGEPCGGYEDICRPGLVCNESHVCEERKQEAGKTQN